MRKTQLEQFLMLDENAIYLTTIDGVALTFRVNKSLLDLDRLLSLNEQKQKHESINVERVNNLEKYKESNFKVGFDLFNIELSSKVGGISILK